MDLFLRCVKFRALQHSELLVASVMGMGR